MYKKEKKTFTALVNSTNSWVINLARIGPKPYDRDPRMKTWLTAKKQTVIDKYRSVIREKAIDQAKVEIALAGKAVTDYNAEQLEIIVKAQEEKIIQRYKNSTLIVFLLALGIY